MIKGVVCGEGVAFIWADLMSGLGFWARQAKMHWLFQEYPIQLVVRLDLKKT